MCTIINLTMRRKRHKQIASERRQGGMAMVEFALLFPIQLFFILAILEIALIQVGRLMVSYSAYCAAHAELMGQDPTEAAVIALIPLCDEEPETTEYPGPDIDITGEPLQPGTGFNFPGWGTVDKWEDARRRVFVTRLVDSSSDVLNRSTIRQEIWEPFHANSIVQHNIGVEVRFLYRLRVPLSLLSIIFPAEELDNYNEWIDEGGTFWHDRDTGETFMSLSERWLLPNRGRRLRGTLPVYDIEDRQITEEPVGEVPSDIRQPPPGQ